MRGRKELGKDELQNALAENGAPRPPTGFVVRAVLRRFRIGFRVGKTGWGSRYLKNIRADFRMGCKEGLQQIVSS